MKRSGFTRCKILKCEIHNVLTYTFIRTIYGIINKYTRLKKLLFIENLVRIYLLLIFPHYSSFVDARAAKRGSKWILNRERIELAIYRAVTRDACRICPGILNFCWKRSARRIDTVSPRYPSHAILRHTFCLWRPLVRNDKHNIHRTDQQPNISGNYVAFGVITRALRVFTFQCYKSYISLPILTAFSLCCEIMVECFIKSSIHAELQFSFAADCR